MAGYKETEAMGVEEWRDIAGYGGRYEVSNMGRVKSNTMWGKGRIMKPYKTGNGYIKAVLSGNARKRGFYIHRLVLAAFVSPSHLQVNHKNAVKTDNRLENLEYCTQKQNMDHAKKNGLLRAVRGEKHGGSKLTDTQAMEIYKLRGARSLRSVARDYGVSRSTVSHIQTGRIWKSVTRLLD